MIKSGAEKFLRSSENRSFWTMMGWKKDTWQLGADYLQPFLQEYIQEIHGQGEESMRSAVTKKSDSEKQIERYKIDVVHLFCTISEVVQVLGDEPVVMLDKFFDRC